MSIGALCSCADAKGAHAQASTRAATILLSPLIVILLSFLLIGAVIPTYHYTIAEWRDTSTVKSVFRGILRGMAGGGNLAGEPAGGCIIGAWPSPKPIRGRGTS